MDWAGCEDVERDPGRMSGAWVVKDTRVLAESIIENARAGFSAETIVTEIFPSVALGRVQRMIDFADKHETHAA